MEKILVENLTAQAFSRFGDVISMEGGDYNLINAGTCQRFHDLARLDFGGPHGRPCISLARAQPQTLPFELKMVERHPLGSQAFIPLSQKPFLVIVADDDNGRPARPLAFVTNGFQGINYLANTWHAVLCPLDEAQSFVIVDREGDGNNLAEHEYDEAFLIAAQ